MKFRSASINDLEQIAELFDNYRVFYEKASDIEAAKKFLSERIINKESVIIVAEDENGKLVGFTQLYPLFSSTRMKRLWLLNDLFVDPNFRGKKISVALINEAKILSNHTNSAGLLLETAKSNHIGNKLYPRCGIEMDHDFNYYSWSAL
jgi:GNAT superfamily N-acetyltransferase